MDQTLNNNSYNKNNKLTKKEGRANNSTSKEKCNNRPTTDNLGQ